MKVAQPCGKLGSEFFRLTVFVNGKEQDERSTEHYCGYFEVVGRSCAGISLLRLPNRDWVLLLAAACSGKLLPLCLRKRRNRNRQPNRTGSDSQIPLSTFVCGICGGHCRIYCCSGEVFIVKAANSVDYIHLYSGDNDTLAESL